jgi:hypothetical protein
MGEIEIGIAAIIFFVVVSWLSEFTKSVIEEKWETTRVLALLMVVGLVIYLALKSAFRPQTDFLAELRKYLLIVLGYFVLLYASVLIKNGAWGKLMIRVPLLGVLGGIIYLGSFGLSSFGRAPMLWRIQRMNLDTVCTARRGIGQDSEGLNGEFTLVVISDLGRLDIDATLALPKDWMPRSPAEIGYVLCMKRRQISAGHCSYYGGSRRNLEQEVLDLQLREASTGHAVAQTRFLGEDPSCPEEVTGPQTSVISGDPVAFYRVESWLAQAARDLSKTKDFPR